MERFYQKGRVGKQGRGLVAPASSRPPPCSADFQSAGVGCGACAQAVSRRARRGGPAIGRLEGGAPGASPCFLVEPDGTATLQCFQAQIILEAMRKEPETSPDWAIASDASSQPERLQKFLARAGVASRRHAEELILAGRVRVNGQPVTQPGTKIYPQTDQVQVDGRPVRPTDASVYLALHKPAGVVTTASDPQGRQTALDLLPANLRAQRVFPVGRLDLDSEGLLLLTNDGAFALRLTHPRYEQEKEYHALVQGQPTPAALEALRRGLLLPGETRPTAPAQARLLRGLSDGTSWLSVTLHEGRKRQARRMLAAVGHPVLRLLRVRVGSLRLGDLPPGHWRALSAAEVQHLMGE